MRSWWIHSSNHGDLTSGTKIVGNPRGRETLIYIKRAKGDLPPQRPPIKGFIGKFDLRDPRVRTCDELNKVFNSVLDFLKFTTESEVDFTDGYLPTLDVETKILDNGKIDYRFFMKPMKNNIVIECGTALSRDIVFSSLRQELVRRLINTSTTADKKTQIDNIEGFIQQFLIVDTSSLSLNQWSYRGSRNLSI